MLLQRIRISRIRNLTDIDLDDISKVNILLGSNGSGKSSFLEALYILSTGRSFRTSQIKQYISHGSTDAVVFAHGVTATLPLSPTSLAAHAMAINTTDDAIKLDSIALKPITLSSIPLTPTPLTTIPLTPSAVEDGINYQFTNDAAEVPLPHFSNNNVAIASDQVHFLAIKNSLSNALPPSAPTTSAHTLAIQKFVDGKNLIKINGEAVHGFSLLAQRLPVIVIDPTALTVFEEGSTARRQLFDWVMFHVEPNFFTVWQRYQRILKQRNSLLKNHQIQIQLRKHQRSHTATNYRQNTANNFANSSLASSIVSSSIPNSAEIASKNINDNIGDAISANGFNHPSTSGEATAGSGATVSENGNNNSNNLSASPQWLDDNNIDDINYWEQQLAAHVVELQAMRQRVFALYQPIFNQYCQQLIDPTLAATLRISVSNGLPSELSTIPLDRIGDELASYYKQHRQQDIERGYTYYGAHRADIRVKTPQGMAEHELSRGQKKMLLIAFKLAQIQLLRSVNKPSVVLLDDIVSELDDEALTRLLAVLAQQQAQVFITALPHNQGAILAHSGRLFAQNDIRLFHVEHGEIKPITKPDDNATD